jgi:hypothetical protein
MDQFDGITRRITNGRPRKSQLIFHFILQRPPRVAQFDLFTVFGQGGKAACIERSEHAADGKLGLNRSRVLADNHITASRQVRGREGELQTASREQAPAREINGCRARIMQFDELHRVRLNVGIVMDFVDDDGAGRRGNSSDHPAASEETT